MHRRRHGTYVPRVNLLVNGDGDMFRKMFIFTHSLNPPTSVPRFWTSCITNGNKLCRLTIKYSCSVVLSSFANRNDPNGGKDGRNHRTPHKTNLTILIFLCLNIKIILTLYSCLGANSGVCHTHFQCNLANATPP